MSAELDADVARVKAMLGDEAAAVWAYHGVSIRLNDKRYVLLASRNAVNRFIASVEVGKDTIVSLLTNDGSGGCLREPLRALAFRGKLAVAR